MLLFCCSISTDEIINKTLKGKWNCLFLLNRSNDFDNRKTFSWKTPYIMFPPRHGPMMCLHRHAPSMQIMPSCHGSFEQAVCPWAWSWPFWRVFHTSWCPQTVQLGKPQPLPEGLELLEPGIEGWFWSLAQFPSPICWKGAFWWAAPLFSGNKEFLSAPRSQACTA